MKLKVHERFRVQFTDMFLITLDSDSRDVERWRDMLKFSILKIKPITITSIWEIKVYFLNKKSLLSEGAEGRGL